MKNGILRQLLFLGLFAFMAETACAQLNSYRELHKVKRKETIFGIAKDNGLTIEELIKANPEMNTPGYELKKGEYIKIPWPSNHPSAGNSAGTTSEIKMPAKPQVQDCDMTQREIRIGIMLPLHDINGDGKRMTEYYRGVLMACDSLRANGISTDVRAWNVAEDSDINKFLQDPHAADRDLIIGPLYSKMVKPMSDFVKKNDIRLLIPFSINAPELTTNRNIYQVFQSQDLQNDSYITHFLQRFSDCHTVIIDCNDSTSKKGNFTFPLRRRLEAKHMTYNVTNLKSGEEMFRKSFSMTKRNVVVLNTGRSPQLGVALARLSGLKTIYPEMQITLFGYTEWMLYTRHQLDNFYRFDTYIPATFYMNPLSSKTDRINLKYRWNFHADMMNALPRFAITGFDHAYFFIKGLHLYGKKFTGASGMVGYTPIQTPLHFERLGNGGLQNKSTLFVHFTTGRKTEIIKF